MAQNKNKDNAKDMIKPKCGSCKSNDNNQHQHESRSSLGKYMNNGDKKS